MTDINSEERIAELEAQVEALQNALTVQQSTETKPTLLQAATAQLPVNQSDNFSFTMNATQRLVPVDSVMAGTRITVNVVDDKNISQRTLVGVVSTLEVTESLITVKVGMLRPRLTLTI